MLEYLLESLGIFAIVAGMGMAARQIIRRVPVLAESRAHNKSEDRERLAKAKYPPVVKQNQMAGLFMFLPLVVIITPFFSSYDALPWWRYVFDILLIYTLYDFLYYLTHRFLFHGDWFGGYFKRVHGLHHQARNPSHIDAQYVHPLETVIGLGLLYIAVITIGVIYLTVYDTSFHIVSMGVCFFVYSNLNILNHCQVDIAKKPWNIATWISVKHHNHHIDMSHGNYATIILLYDWMFGTFE